MKFNIKKEKRCQYFSPDNASTALFSNALNKHIAYLNKKYEDLVLLCIGTDKITGDCLGPLVGSKLMQQNFPHPLYGTLEKPLHAGNLTRQLPEISTAHPNACTLAIDAAVGSRNHIGLVSLSCQPLFPGKGVSRSLSPVGNISITGIINEFSSSEILLPLPCRLPGNLYLQRNINDNNIVSCRFCVDEKRTTPLLFPKQMTNLLLKQSAAETKF